jgi:predicted aspartyl protease
LIQDKTINRDKTAKLIFQGTANGHPAEIMIDSGADRNFCGENLVKKLKLKTVTTKPSTIVTADGKETRIVKEARNIQVKIQGYKTTIEVQVLPNYHKQIILGNGWLARHNPRIDWKERTLAITKNGTTTTIQANSSTKTKRLQIGYIKVQQETDPEPEKSGKTACQEAINISEEILEETIITGSDSYSATKNNITTFLTTIILLILLTISTAYTASTNSSTFTIVRERVTMARKAATVGVCQVMERLYTILLDTTNLFTLLNTFWVRQGECHALTQQQAQQECGEGGEGRDSLGVLELPEGQWYMGYQGRSLKDNHGRIPLE